MTLAVAGSRPMRDMTVMDLPTARLAHDAEGLAALEREGDAAHGLGGAALGLQADVEVVDFEEAWGWPRVLVVAMSLTSRAEARIEQVAQAVAQQVQAQHRQRDRHAREDAPAGAAGTSGSAPR